MDRRSFLAVGGASLSALLLETACKPEGRQRGGVTQERFDLRIRIGGLCMLVPDPRYKRLHVLMPATSGRHGKMRETARGCEGPVQEHRPVLRYGKDNDPQDILLEQDPPLDLTRLGTGEPRLDSIPPGVVDLTAGVVRQSVRRNLIVANPPQQVRCRVTFAAGEVIAGDYDKGIKWEIEQVGEYPTLTQRMAVDLYWTIAMQGSSLPQGTIHAEMPELFPESYNGKPTVNIGVIHLPYPRDRRPDPVYNETAYDFEGYYTLFDERLSMHPLPVLRQTETFHNPRCILAQAAITG